ncbi:MAG TPA: NAD(P)-dependent oxidoreductase [Terracidiphilus sp.]|jgi:putative NADH-flavin reductase|nr:NAD(P)-dependent oxidoreductase [Terracidiphilus sp.]
MNVVLFGASGMVGSRVLAELLKRGHSVTAVARNPEKINAAGAKAVRGDITDASSVAAVAQGADAVIGAYAPPQSAVETLVPATHALLAGVAQAGVTRLLVVGGAGSLEVAPGVQLVDTPSFPEQWKGIALAHRDVLPIFKDSNLDWTYLSPAAFIQPGERTGKFRLGTTRLVVDAKGESRISAEDFAIVLVDELEQSKHLRQQFTAAY